MRRRVAIVADAQGNAVALAAALADAARHHPDTLVCLGDVACGPEPRRALGLLEQAGALGVRGNMDDALARGGDPAPGTGDPDAQRFAAIDTWAAERLGPAGRQALAARPLALELPLGDDGAESLLCCHGSLRSNDDAPAPDTPDAELADAFRGIGARIAVGASGNRHEPMLRRWNGPGRARLLLHPGSVGWPAPDPDGLRTPLARYALVTAEPAGIEVAFRAVGYDPAAFAIRVRASGMPHADWYLGHWRLEPF